LNDVDVIGVMTAISAEREYVKEGKVTKMVILELTDDRFVLPVLFSMFILVGSSFLNSFFGLILNSGKCECALFGDYVDALQKMVGKSVGGMPIVVLQYVKIKTFRGCCLM